MGREIRRTARSNAAPQISADRPSIAKSSALVETGPVALSVRERTKLAGLTASTLDVYSHLPPPKDLADAFDSIEVSSTGEGSVRRFADDNVGAWNLVLDLARSATRTMDFSFFTIGKDAYGFSFVGAALFNQMRGVQVTGMTDWSSNSRGRGFVSAGFGYDYLQELAEFGAKIGVFNTPMKRVNSLVRDGFNYGLIGCNHDKALLIDKGTPDAQGETGGRNIEAPYHQSVRDNPQAWRDDSLHIKGNEATIGLATAIEREFAGRATKEVQPDTINVRVRAREMLMAYAMMEAWVERPAFSEAEKAELRSSPYSRARLTEDLVDAASLKLTNMISTLSSRVQKKIPKALTFKETDTIQELASELTNDLELAGSRPAYEKLNGWMSAEVKVIDQTGAASATPGQRHNEIAPALLHLFRGAQKEIIIQNPYVVLTENMMKALEEVAARGVKIKIVTNSPESTDSAITQGFFLNDWAHLLARVPTAQIFVATGERKLHAKCFTIDDEVAGDLSYNADLLSGLVNGEIGAISRSEANAKNLREHIERDIADPTNGYREWTIKKDKNNRAVLDGNKNPIVINGPEQTIAKKIQLAYKPMQFLCSVLSNTKVGAPLSHPPVAEILANRAW